MDLFPRTSGAADIQMDVSSHVETVVLLDREKADGDVGIDLDIKKTGRNVATAACAGIKAYSE